MPLFCPIPLFLMRRSVFEQDQSWHLASDSCLVLADGHTAGRMAFGEHFAYSSYRSDITVHTAERPILIERYYSEPGALSPAYTGAFGAYNVVFNIFVAGNSARFSCLVECLSQSLAPLLKPSQDSLLLSFASPKARSFCDTIPRAKCRVSPSPLYSPPQCHCPSQYSRCRSAGAKVLKWSVVSGQWSVHPVSSLQFLILSIT